MLMTRSTLFLLLGAAVFLRADTSKIIGDWDSVSMAPVKTSIYVGSVKLTTSEFRRAGDKFTATYEAKVWPWFFWSESGKIAISLPLAELEKLARGERVEFSGEAFNHKNKPRLVTGRAQPINSTSVKMKIRIKVDDLELIFNGTYQFGNVAP